MSSYFVMFHFHSRWEFFQFSLSKISWKIKIGVSKEINFSRSPRIFSLSSTQHNLSAYPSIYLFGNYNEISKKKRTRYALKSYWSMEMKSHGWSMIWMRKSWCVRTIFIVVFMRMTLIDGISCAEIGLKGNS